MHEFIKKMFGGNRPTVKNIGFDEIPAWLSEHERTAREVLLSDTAEPIRTIRNAAAQLQLIVNSVENAEHDAELHPKLKSIAKNSLPLFVKAMNASLVKELPNDPDDFYAAAVECVKGCLNCARGQGRYLQVVFPEEMKSVKTGIDAMGREINIVTGFLTKFRKEMQDIAAIRSVYSTVVDLKSDFLKSAEKDRRMTLRIAEITNRIEAIGNEELALSGDERQAGIEAKRDELNNIAKARDEVTRSYSTLSMTASHVFRKAEKIATRQHHTQDIALINNAMDILSSHDIPDADQLSAILSGACPIAEKMVTAGDIILKNKEERAIFSDIPQFCITMRSTCQELAKREEEYRKTEEALATDPLLMKISSLGREKVQLKSMLEKEQRAQRDLAEWRVKTREKIPTLTEDLRKKIASMEENVQIQINDEILS
jgi:hypothetical protein